VRPRPVELSRIVAAQTPHPRRGASIMLDL
jgi:hypothetical protein